MSLFNFQRYLETTCGYYHNEFSWIYHNMICLDGLKSNKESWRVKEKQLATATKNIDQWRSLMRRVDGRRSGQSDKLFRLRRKRRKFVEYWNFCLRNLDKFYWRISVNTKHSQKPHKWLFNYFSILTNCITMIAIESVTCTKVPSKRDLPILWWLIRLSFTRSFCHKFHGNIHFLT